MTKERSDVMEAGSFRQKTNMVVEAVYEKERQQPRGVASHQSKPVKQINNCTKCGRNHEINKCPAFGKTCAFCKYKNHFVHCCFKQKYSANNYNSERILQINEENESSDEFLFIGSLQIDTVKKEQWYTNLQINNHDIKFKIDTGAEANVIPFEVLQQIGISGNEIEKTNVKLTAYARNILSLKGRCNLKCSKGDRKYEIQFYVMKGYAHQFLD